MPPAPTPSHQDSVFDFGILLRNWVTQRKLGKVYVAPLDMVLTPQQVTQPNVLFISKARLTIVKKAIFGPADLVAEVVSGSSHQRDRIRKRDLYEQHGVREYWVIDSTGGTIEVFFLATGQYKLVGRWRAGEIAKSKLLVGFEVKVSDILAAS